MRQRLLALACLCFAACDDGANLQATGEQDSTTTDSDTGEPAVDFGCAAARWSVVERASDDITAIAVDSRGHVRFVAGLAPFGVRVLDLDAAGKITADPRFDNEAASIRFAGLDGEDNMALSFEEREGADPRLWLRSFDTAAKQRWQTDLGPSPNTHLLGIPVVAPDGAVVVGIQIVPDAKLTLRKYDSAGELLWEIDNENFWVVQDTDAAGRMLAITIAASHLTMLDADGGVLWERDWDGPMAELGRLDAAGNAVVVSGAGSIARFGSDGAIVWEATSEALPIPLSQIKDIAVNTAGEIAIAGVREGGGGDTAFKLSPDGALASEVVCERISISRVGIDDVGALYLGGSHFRNGAYDAFMAAFD